MKLEAATEKGFELGQKYPRNGFELQLFQHLPTVTKYSFIPASRQQILSYECRLDVGWGRGKPLALGKDKNVVDIVLLVLADPVLQGVVGPAVLALRHHHLVRDEPGGGTETAKAAKSRRDDFSTLHLGRTE